MTALISLLEHRWNIELIAELYLSSGSKFVTLANRLGLSRASLSASLLDLNDKGLLTRNIGHGHPLRPEYLLTKRGKALGKDCVALSKLIRKQKAGHIAYRKWSLPLLLVVGKSSSRFNALRSALGVITPRAITLTLKATEELGWIRRRVVDGYPPTAIYQLKADGLRVLDILHRLCAH